MKPILELAADLASAKATSRTLVEKALARIADPEGEGGRVFVAVHAEAARAAAEASDTLRAVGIVLSPIAVGGPVITIRKFQHDRFDVDDLIRIGSLNEAAAGFLRASVVSKINMLISGGTGSGKTTMLNALSAFIPEQERIVTIEDPKMYTAPWTVSAPMFWDPGYEIYEYACHEGNYAVENILRGGRVQEQDEP